LQTSLTIKQTRSILLFGTKIYIINVKLAENKNREMPP